MKEIFYFLLGAVAGAIFALLFAPQSGAELRANIQSTAEKDWQKLQAEWMTGMEKANARLDQMQSELKQVLQKQDQADSETPITS
jgi:gas vesicle protein